MVIVLTHLSLKNDIDLATNVQGIDIILGGHDHIIFSKSYQNSMNHKKEIPLIKSGSDFYDLTVIDVFIGEENHKKTVVK